MSCQALKIPFLQPGAALKPGNISWELENPPEAARAAAPHEQRVFFCCQMSLARHKREEGAGLGTLGAEESPPGSWDRTGAVPTAPSTHRDGLCH